MNAPGLVQGWFRAVGLSFALMAVAAPWQPGAAGPLVRAGSVAGLATDDSGTLIRARGVARGPAGGAVAHGPRGTVARGPHGNVGAVRHVPARPVVVAPGYRRPAGYWWRPGGAIAAGAALGFVTAAAASSYAGSPPASGYCWYYTNPQRTQGFWDVCPR